MNETEWTPVKDEDLCGKQQPPSERDFPKVMYGVEYCTEQRYTLTMRKVDIRGAM